MRRQQRRRLNLAEVREIRSLFTTTTMTQAEIGKRFGVAQTTIGSIVRGETHLEPETPQRPPAPPTLPRAPEPETEKPDAKGDQGRFGIKAKFAVKIGSSLIRCPNALSEVVEALMRMSVEDLCTLRSRVDALHQFSVTK